MNSEEPQNFPIWLPPTFDRADKVLSEDQSFEIVVIGGGIVGLTTAFFLNKAGYDVCLLEAHQIATGTTGASTAKVTALHGLIYSDLEKKYGSTFTRIYADANNYGIEQIFLLSEEMKNLGIDCEFERKDAYTFTEDDNNIGQIETEIISARKAGLEAAFTSKTGLPFKVSGAICLQNQGQINPYRYCKGLAKLFQKNGGKIYENARVENIRMTETQVICEGSTFHISSDKLVIATLLPFMDRGLFFSRAYPSRSHVLVVETKDPTPNGMYISVESPKKSVRQLGPHSLIIAGEESKVGDAVNPETYFNNLEKWAYSHFPIHRVSYKWFAHDYISADRLPLIGEIPFTHKRVYTATGFGKWGLSMGTAAGKILLSQIQDEHHPWSSLFHPKRFNLKGGIQKFIKENIYVGKTFICDRIEAPDYPSLSSLRENSGGIVKEQNHMMAVYRDEKGQFHKLSPICTHLGCYVRWNTWAKTWDCPCHGSRFSYDGEVLCGPATKPLSQIKN